MIIKLKLKSIDHPSLDELMKHYNLKLSPLMEGVPYSTLYTTINSPEKDLRSEYDLRADLRMCEDVEEIIDDFENSEPV